MNPASASDDDGDGLSSDCEHELAARFAPELLADPADCSWNESGRLGGGYFYAVQSLSNDRDSVRIAYLPAYFRDCGWHGFARAIRLGRSSAHAGDSELVMLDVGRDSTGAWSTIAVFLSAHCFGRAGGRCRWFRGAELQDFGWVGGGPRVWVARDKHANYPSRESCESGHWHQERCSPSPRTFRFPIVRLEQNIGSRARPRFDVDGCVASERLPLPSAIAAPGARECLWSRSAPFRGWQTKMPGSATPYGTVLSRTGGL